MICSILSRNYVSQIYCIHF